MTAEELRTFAPRTDPRAFRTALGAFATGVTVITVLDEAAGPVGLTANSFASVSLDPPLVLWSLARTSRRFSTFAGAETYAIHVLAADQQDVCDAFARNGQGFAAVAWSADADGVPLIDGCLARFACRRHAAMDAGDHVILLGSVSAAAHRAGAPLVFQAGQYGNFVPTAEEHPSPEPDS